MGHVLPYRMRQPNIRCTPDSCPLVAPRHFGSPGPEPEAIFFIASTATVSTRWRLWEDFALPHHADQRRRDLPVTLDAQMTPIGSSAARLPQYRYVDCPSVDDPGTPRLQLTLDCRDICHCCGRTHIVPDIISWIVAQDYDLRPCRDGARNTCKCRVGGLPPNASIYDMNLRASGV